MVYGKVSLNYCSQNGGNLYRAPYYNRNLNIGPPKPSTLFRDDALIDFGLAGSPTSGLRLRAQDLISLDPILKVDLPKRCRFRPPTPNSFRAWRSQVVSKHRGLGFRASGKQGDLGQPQARIQESTMVME